MKHLALVLAGLALAQVARAQDHCAALSPDVLAEESHWRPSVDPDWRESDSDLARLREVEASTPPAATPRGPGVPARRQPQGALSGILVFCNGGHGWTADDLDATPSDGDFGWYTQRGLTNGIVEDYGNLDQLNMFAIACFNAGATVIPMRPLGEQPIERVLDNDDPGVTYTGAWTNSTSTIFFGSAGDTPYRFASKSVTETATARFTPDIPSAGYYPVYTWVRAGSDRTDQLYRVVHGGGATELRVNHRRVGNGWVWLGTHYFEAGTSGYVEVSNLERPGETGSLVFADAIRFGNGMGDIPRPPAGVSGYPREEESARYWIQSMIGQGGDATTYDLAGGDDYDDSLVAPPRMSRAMNREVEGTFYDRIHLSFHTNCCSARGAMGLINTVPTPDQSIFAAMVNAEVEADAEALDSGVEFPGDWSDTSGDTLTGGYGEISNNSLSNEMCATIIEVGFHDTAADADLLRDPKFRWVAARSSAKSIIRFLNQQGGGAVPLAFPPGTPTHVRAVNSGGGGVTVSWSAPPAQPAVGDPPTGYVVYRSTNGRGFGDPVTVAGAGTTSVVIPGLAPGQAYYFQVAATNAGGESPATESAPVRVGAANVLFVNGYDRLDASQSHEILRSTNLGSTAGGGGVVLLQRPLRMNAGDYAAEFAPAMVAAGVTFDGASNEAVLSGAVSLASYGAVVWELGNESTADETFSTAEQALVAAYLDGGGRLFASGAEIAWDLDRFTGPSAGDRAFFNTYLGADYVGDDADTFTAQGSIGPGLIFDGLGSLSFDPALGARYGAYYPDRVSALGASASVCMTYVGGFGGNAAVQQDTGSFRTVYLGFPFECITSPAVRADVMTRVINFFALSGSAIGEWSEY